MRAKPPHPRRVFMQQRPGAAGDGRGVAGPGRSRWRDPSSAAARPAGRSGWPSRQRSLPRTTTPSHRRVERGPDYRPANSQRGTSSYRPTRISRSAPSPKIPSRRCASWPRLTRPTRKRLRQHRRPRQAPDGWAERAFDERAIERFSWKRWTGHSDVVYQVCCPNPQRWS